MERPLRCCTCGPLMAAIGWVQERIRRVCRRAGFSHVVICTDSSSSLLGAVEADTLLDAASHGQASRWHLLVPVDRPGATLNELWTASDGAVMRSVADSVSPTHRSPLYCQRVLIGLCFVEFVLGTYLTNLVFFKQATVLNMRVLRAGVNSKQSPRIMWVGGWVDLGNNPPPTPPPPRYPPVSN